MSRNQQVKAGIYTRVSLDRDGTSESPDRQRADCVALATAKGFEVVDVYEDRDVSAYRRGAARPEYERLLKDVDEGVIDAVVVWKLDRLTRQGLTGLAPLLNMDPRPLLVAVQDSIDTTTPMGRGIAGLLASMAEEESANISKRVARAHQGSAEKGRPHSGGSRPYGYTHDGEVVPEEAAIIREVAGRVLDGESLRSIAGDLNERETRTSTDGIWHASVLGNMIRSPRLAGFRVRNGDTYQGDWAPILDVDTHARLAATRGAPRAYRKPRHLLAGIAYCGLCDGKLKVMHMRMRSGNVFDRYQCVKTPGQINCGKVAITKRSVDDDVKQRLFKVLSSGELLPDRDAPELDEEGLRRLLDQDRRRVSELTRARFVDEQIQQPEYLDARAELDTRIERTERALDDMADERKRVERAPGLRPGSVEDLERWWEAADERERREAVHAAITSVTVHPAKSRGGNRYDPDRLTVRFNWSTLMKVAQRADPAEREAAEADYRRLVQESWDEPLRS